MSARHLDTTQSVDVQVIKKVQVEPTEAPLLVKIPNPISILVNRRTVAVLNEDGSVVVEVEVPVNQTEIMVTRPEKGQTIHFYDYANTHLLGNRGYPL